MTVSPTARPATQARGASGWTAPPKAAPEPAGRCSQAPKVCVCVCAVCVCVPCGCVLCVPCTCTVLCMCAVCVCRVCVLCCVCYGSTGGRQKICAS